MNLSSLSVRRGVTFGMMYLLILVFGMFSLSRLNLDLFPDISFPSVIAITNYTGASPEDMETLVTRPLEGALSSVKNVKRVLSDSKQGISLLTAEFQWGQDMELAETHVRRAIEMVKGYLPTDADAPMIFAFDPSLQPVIMMMIRGPYPLPELRQLAKKEIQPRLERLNGVATAQVEGGLEREIHVVLDPVKLEAFALDVNAVVGAIYQENLQMPGGAVEQGSLDFTIHTQGKFQQVVEIGEVVVGVKLSSSGPEPIRLKDVAKVEDTFIESQRILEVDGEPAVFILIRKQSGANTVRVCESILDALPTIKKDLVSEFEYKILYDQSEIVNLALGNLSSSGMVGVIICFFVLLFFLLNMRSSLIVSTAIPLSVIATFVVMDQAKMTLNILSMAGLSLGVGMLVDNAIVVLENIFRLRQEGMNSWNASIQGAKTVGLAVTASTLTTVAVFVPVLFVPGIAGVLFRDMAVTICFALMVSLFVSLTFIPLAASRLLGTQRAGRLLERASRRDLLRGFRNWYGKALDWVLSHRWVVWVGLALLILFTALLYPIIPKEFIAEDDQAHIFVQVETPVGTNLDNAHGMIKEVEKRVLELVKPEERMIVSLDVGVAKGFVSIFSKGVHAGTLQIKLVPMEKRKRSQKQIEDVLRAELKKMPGIKVTVAMPFNPMGGEGDIEIQIRGHDLDASRRIGLELQNTFQAWPEMSYVNFSMEEQKPELRIKFDRQKLAQLGISSGAAGSAISAYFMGKIAGRFSEGGDEYDIVVRYDRSHRQDIDDVRRLPLVTRTGAVIKLANVADIQEDLAPVTISRLNQERVTRLTLALKAEYQDSTDKAQRKDLSTSIPKVQQVLKGYPWPQGFSWHIGGTAEDFMDSFKNLAFALLVAVFIVFMVMASQFESFRQPFIIMFTVPLAGIGVMIMYAVTQTNLDVSGLIGIIMLPGIAVNNGIVMVDAANQFREQGMGRREAILRASVIRLRPVLMTALTTIFAMVPMALGIGEGAQQWAGMARAVIGGLVSATIFTLVVVPVVYTVFTAKTLKSKNLEAEANPPVAQT